MSNLRASGEEDLKLAGCGCRAQKRDGGEPADDRHMFEEGL
jgi:hypothetical protein